MYSSLYSEFLECMCFIKQSYVILNLLINAVCIARKRLLIQNVFLRRSICMEITKCDYNSLKYAQRNRDDDRYGNHGKEMCKLFLFFPLFSYMSLHIHCIRVMNWSNLKKKPNEIIKEHSQHESETYSRFIFFSHSKYCSPFPVFFSSSTKR